MRMLYLKIRHYSRFIIIGGYFRCFNPFFDYFDESCLAPLQVRFRKFFQIKLENGTMYFLLNSFPDIAAALRLIESFLSYSSFLYRSIQKINDFLKNNQGIFPISLMFVFIPTSKDYFEVNTNEIIVYHNALNQSIRFSLNKCMCEAAPLYAVFKNI